MIFLIAYYRLLGIVAAIGLLIYAALFYAVVVLWPITLTLPGIAGVILTIGISADANVIIFERVREEARSGKSAAVALSQGYKRGLAAIIDANVVTLATAILVFMFATAGPKGFAFTLGVGVLISLFTAVVATRAIFGVLIDSKIVSEDRFMGLKKGRVFHFDWVGHWRWWLLISTVPVCIGLIWLAVFGLNLGLDFTSGTRITTGLDRPATVAQVRQTVASAGFPDATVQGLTSTSGGKANTEFQIATKALDQTQIRTLRQALDVRYGVNTKTFNLEEVGPTFGREVIRNAIYAIVLSLLIVLAYLIVRFEYRLALPAMLSVVHDVLLSLGVYAITGREVTSDTVAALLTILGYSLYDVVIVFDRIRENVPLMRGSRYRAIVNRSINETITRSVITTLITLIPVLSLFIFGGPTLQDFSFALLVGILSGGVSSIVIAAPLASWWKEHQPEQRKAVGKRTDARSTTPATPTSWTSPPWSAPSARSWDCRTRSTKSRRGPPSSATDGDVADEAELSPRWSRPSRPNCSTPRPCGNPTQRSRRCPRRRCRRHPARARRAAGSARTAPPSRPGAEAPDVTPPSIRDAVEQAILLSVGAAALTRDRIEGIVGELVAQGRVSADDGRELVERLITRVVDPQRPSPSGLMGHVEDTLRSALSDAGVVTRAEVDDLRVHLAELDHRLRIIEGGGTHADADEPPAAG